jgi:hypothetical protein
VYFCRKIVRVIDADVYRNSTGGSGVGESAAKVHASRDCDGLDRDGAVNAVHFNNRFIAPLPLIARLARCGF